ncbi:VF530 family DNA-binding protein [Pleionea sediminis]|uniref:VF530 family protein n=1 Tax=Pleionea sediminis TaxID=2569479 RepID=UPI0011857DFA|nr:VF530 family DNA-binding protein [Pleionea sediminis]
MTNDDQFQNNPLQGVSLQTLVTEIVDHYGFEILYAYLRINCFKTNPSIESSIKFLKKTEWAREKVESFYLYKYKNLPRASAKQFQLPPRDRVIPDDQKPGEPAELTLKQAENIHKARTERVQQREEKHGERVYKQKKSHKRNEKAKPQESKETNTSQGKDPWSKWKK